MGKKLTTKQFIEKSKEVHGRLYDYSLVDYIGTFSRVDILCRVHGIFQQKPNAHLSGKGCILCQRENQKKTTEQFIKESKEVHGDKYDYSLVEYSGTNHHVKIVCKEHGIFKQTPNAHLRTRGCPRCSTSKGERKIMNILESNGVGFETEKSFSDLNGVGGGSLRFDFGIEDKNLLIEYDGKQHFVQPNTEWISKKTFNRIQKHDKLKNEFCETNGIKLLRIKYTDYDKIEEILDSNGVLKVNPKANEYLRHCL